MRFRRIIVLTVISAIVALAVFYLVAVFHGNEDSVSCENAAGRSVISLDIYKDRLSLSDGRVKYATGVFARCETEFEYNIRSEKIHLIAAFMTDNGDILLIYELQFTSDVLRVAKVSNEGKLLGSYVASGYRGLN